MPLPVTGPADELADSPSREANPGRGSSRPEQSPEPDEIADAPFGWRAETAASRVEDARPSSDEEALGQRRDDDARPAAGEAPSALPRAWIIADYEILHELG